MDPMMVMLHTLQGVLDANKVLNLILVVGCCQLVTMLVGLFLLNRWRKDLHITPHTQIGVLLNLQGDYR